MACNIHHRTNPKKNKISSQKNQVTRIESGISVVNLYKCFINYLTFDDTKTPSCECNSNLPNQALEADLLWKRVPLYVQI